MAVHFFYFSSYMTSTVLHFITTTISGYFYLFATLPLAIILIKMLYTLNGEALNKTLELSAKFAGLYGLLFSIGLII